MTLTLSPDTNLLAGAAGGVLIAISSTSLLYLTGNILGVSGIVSKLLSSKAAWTSWRASFFVGMIGAGHLIARFQPQMLGPPSTLRPAAIAIAGVLVGFGTRMANGCTSGHGVCGLPRLSLRSLVAVCTFMFSGALTAFLVRSNPVLASLTHGVAAGPASSLSWMAEAAMSVLALGISAYASRKSWSTPKQADGASSLLVGAGCGTLFGGALALSGMTDVTKVLGFLDFTNPHGWDPTLAAVMGGAVLVNLFTFRKISGCEAQPSCASGECERNLNDIVVMGAKPANQKIDAKLVGGAFLFGVGWGLGGMCPGPILVSLGAGVSSALLAFPCMAIGMAIHELIC